jgi:hypothetical protein
MRRYSRLRRRNQPLLAAVRRAFRPLGAKPLLSRDIQCRHPRKQYR